MAVASLPISRLSLVQSSLSPSPANAHSLRLASTQSFSIAPFSHVARKGFPLLELRRRPFVVVAATTTLKKKADSAAKRARQAEKNRMYNRARKSEIGTRMKKVFVALDGLKKDVSASAEKLSPIETLIAEAFSTIDKAVKVGTIHKNTGARRKSRLSRAKKTLEKEMGWYTESPTTATP